MCKFVFIVPQSPEVLDDDTSEVIMRQVQLSADHFDAVDGTALLAVVHPAQQQLLAGHLPHLQQSSPI